MSGIERSKPSPIRKMRPLATHARLIVDTRNVFDNALRLDQTPGLELRFRKRFTFKGTGWCCERGLNWLKAE
ncbi:hypothetical protein SAMN05880592_12039 [Bosea sp. TND4EK4]|nr:hypothetical protein SAMN05880592_12039 [Bosea sp. TND4EK4]